ncbi:MAG: hypothetical protein ABIG66_02375 [Candidatus Kerfeldbacteria bacterium]
MAVGLHVKEFIGAGYAFVDEFARVGGTDEDYFAFVHNERLMRKLARMIIRNRDKWQLHETEMEVSLDQKVEAGPDVPPEVPRWRPKKRVRHDVVIAPSQPEIVLTERDTDSQETWDDDDYTLVVNYNLTPRELIARGQFVYVDPKLNTSRLESHGDGDGRVVRELVIVQLDRPATSGEIQAEISDRKLRMADLEELISFGLSLHDLTHDRPITIFAKLGGNRRHAVNLTQDGKKRMLTVGRAATTWDSGWRFLTARAPSFSDEDLQRWTGDPDETPPVIID